MGFIEIVLDMYYYEEIVYYIFYFLVFKEDSVIIKMRIVYDVLVK